MAACHTFSCGVTADCHMLQAERLEERKRQEEQRRREQHRGDHLRSARDQVHLGLITVTVRYCFVFVYRVVFFLALQWILVINVASSDTISRPLQRKRPMSAPLLTYNYIIYFIKLHFLWQKK